jgi:hypothetical protein
LQKNDYENVRIRIYRIKGLRGLKCLNQDVQDLRINGMKMSESGCPGFKD